MLKLLKSHDGLSPESFGLAATALITITSAMRVADRLPEKSNVKPSCNRGSKGSKKQMSIREENSRKKKKQGRSKETE